MSVGDEFLPETQQISPVSGWVALYCNLEADPSAATVDLIFSEPLIAWAIVRRKTAGGGCITTVEGLTAAESVVRCEERANFLGYQQEHERLEPWRAAALTRITLLTQRAA